MENKRVEIIFIAFSVALFLLNTDRVEKAIKLCYECLFKMSYNTEDNDLQSVKLRLNDIFAVLCCVYHHISDYINCERCCRIFLVLGHESDDLVMKGVVTMILAQICEIQRKFKEAKQLYKSAVNIRAQTGDKIGEINACGKCGTMFYKLGEYIKAKKYFERALAIAIEICDRDGEALSYVNLGAVFESLGEYVRAKEHIERALSIRIEIGDLQEQATCYGNLGVVFKSLGNYVDAEKYLEKALAIRTEIGDRLGKAADYGNLGTVFYLVGKNDKAKEYFKKALVVEREIGDRNGESLYLINLGTVFSTLGQNVEAKRCFEEALAITTEIGDRKGEATCYGNMGQMSLSLCEYVKAREYLEKALVIRTEIGDRSGDATDDINLATLFMSLGEYDKAQEYLERSLAITTKIGCRKGVVASYIKLGTVFIFLGDCVKAKEYVERALTISIEVGDRKGEASCYGSLGTVFEWLGEYIKAKEHSQRALAISIDIGDRDGEAEAYTELGKVFKSLGQNVEAKDYFKQALVIRIDSGNRRKEAECYGVLATVFSSLGQYVEAKEYLRKALHIRTEIGDREGEAADYANLGNLFTVLGDYQVAEACLEKALYISKIIKGRNLELQVLFGYSILFLHQNKLKDALWYLHQNITKFEELRNFLGINDQFKTSFLEERGEISIQLLSWSLCVTGSPHDALYVEELGRAAGLSDLMAEKYSIETHICAKKQSWFGIENIVRKENRCTFLYVSYFYSKVNLWILKTSGALHFKQISVEENVVKAKFTKDSSVVEVLADSFRSFGCLPTEECEDRSLQMREPQAISSKERTSATSRLIEEDNNEEEISSLSRCYEIFIAPIYDFLEEPEVIIVPHRSLYKVPFAALQEKGAPYFSESHRIRVVPSLTILKLIQDSPLDYHSNTGALVVGNPKVNWLLPLPCAEKEVEMVGRLVGVSPLVGEKATKQAVLEQITSVSLIHFAAHGDAERGEIALSPIPTPDTPDIIPPQHTYMLTMGDISRVKIRAKLVVLSCCHSANGQIKAEGVIGIARAFLGSGARSVLVALWAIPDAATEQFMRQFYEHLVDGESASESLHQAMKWMRNNGFTRVRDWASFMLIGDDMKLEFGKQRKEDLEN